MSEKANQEKVKVTDRRRFSSDGEPIETAPEPKSTEEKPPAEKAAEKTAEKISTEGDRPQSTPPPAPPPAKFETLIVLLSVEVQAALGLVAPESLAPDLPLAQHMIDLLAVLQEKTKGNLTLEEQRLLENTLTELRFRYVHKVDEIKQQAKS